MRAIDAVDTLKSERPILGKRKALDYGAAKKSRLAEEGTSVEKVTEELVDYCEGLMLWGPSAYATKCGTSGYDFLPYWGAALLIL